MWELLTGLAVNLIAFVSKKTAKAIKELFSGDELKGVMEQAFKEFKESSVKGKGTTGEKILLEVFDQFFSDDRIKGEFQLVFDAQSEKVDFNLLEEIFVGFCIPKGIEILTFNFFKAISHVIKQIEMLAQTRPELQANFQLAHLDKIHSHLQARGTEQNLTFARFKYLNQLILHNNRLQFTGIPDLKEKKDIELPSVFVMQRARESVPQEDYRRLVLEQSQEQGFTGEEIELRRMMPVKTAETREPVKFNQVFNDSANPRFVVLGKPGSGKSTLLKFLVLQAAQQHMDRHRDKDNLLFPILVEIRKFENALRKTNKTDFNILDFLYDSMSHHYQLRLPRKFFEEYLDSGRALLLFDGLDEVAEEARRAQVRQMIAAFVTNHHMGNTVIVTSRIAGYSRAQFSTTDYRHFTLEDFNDEEMDEFVHKWYRTRMFSEVEADKKAEDLKKALDRKPRIKELAKNPLLLTIIGIIHRYEAQLPEDRLVLYEKATEALLYTWDNVKEIIDEKFKLSHRRRFLGKVAIHLQSMEKGDEAGTMMERSQLYNILLEDFCKTFDCDKWEGQELVNKFLDTIRARAGLLVELAPDRFGFAHKTFQEYFAAQWIANEATLNYNLQIMIDYVDKFIDNAFWHETLLLALRALPETQALNVLKHILDRDPRKIEPYFYHNHYFVMKFIAEQGEWLNDKEFVETQINDFFRFSWNEGKWRSFHKNYTWQRFNEWLSYVSDSFVTAFLSERLLSIAEDEKQDSSLRVSCASAVGNLGVKGKAVVERLLHLAEDEKQDGPLRRDCASAVGNLGVQDKAVKILFHLAEDEKQDGSLRFSCTDAVGNLGVKDKAVVERLLHLAEDEKQEGYLRNSCASAVGNLGVKDKALVERLLHLAEDEKQVGYLRRSCASAVGNLGVKDKAVVERLLHLAEDEKQVGVVRGDFATAVGNLGLKDKAVEILLHCAEDEEQDSYSRGYCATAVSNLGMKDKAVVERLLHLGEDEKQLGGFRHSCATAVGNLGMKDKAVEIFLHLAEDEKQLDNIRGRSADAVGNLGVKDKAVAERLLHRAEDEKQDGYLRRSCAYAVGKLGFKEKAVDILIDLYLAQTDKYDREAKLIYDSLWELTDAS